MIEAMACGTPVIAFNCGSVPEVMEDGLTGFVVKDVDGRGGGGAPGSTGCSGRRIRARFEERFSARAMARDYVKIYQDLAPGEAIAVAAE